MASRQRRSRSPCGWPGPRAPVGVCGISDREEWSLIVVAPLGIGVFAQIVAEWSGERDAVRYGRCGTPCGMLLGVPCSTPCGMLLGVPCSMLHVWLHTRLRTVDTPNALTL